MDVIIACHIAKTTYIYLELFIARQLLWFVIFIYVSNEMSRVKAMNESHAPFVWFTNNNGVWRQPIRRSDNDWRLEMKPIKTNRAKFTAANDAVLLSPCERARVRSSKSATLLIWLISLMMNCEEPGFDNTTIKHTQSEFTFFFFLLFGIWLFSFSNNNLTISFT